MASSAVTCLEDSQLLHELKLGKHQKVLVITRLNPATFQISECEIRPETNMDNGIQPNPIAESGSKYSGMRTEGKGRQINGDVGSVTRKGKVEHENGVAKDESTQINGCMGSAEFALMFGSPQPAK